MSMPGGRSVAAAARAVLLTGDPRGKAMAARALDRDRRAGRIAHRFDVAMPDRPARPARPVLLPPGRMPRRRKAGGLAGRIALLHAIAHIEFNAIDLAVDMAGRFGTHFPVAFVDDWLRVAAEEAMHFALIVRHLHRLGIAYGDLPAHDGLWEAAAATAHDPVARLAIVPLVLEARGLDMTPGMIGRLRAAGDERAAAILGRILTDEIGHVAIGTRWFGLACAERGLDPAPHWRDIIRRHHHGGPKPPFNASARDAAGLTQDYYAPVATAVPLVQQ